MATATISTSFTANGLTPQRGAITITDESGKSEQTTADACIAGVLTTRTDADDGVITVASHDITTSDTISIFYTGGYKRNATVTETTETTITFTSEDGEDLPAGDAAVTVAKEAVIDVDFIGDNLKALAIACDNECQMSFYSAAAAELFSVRVEAGYGFVWYDGINYTNPLASGTVAYIQTANAGTTDKTVTLNMVLNSVD